MKNVIVIPVYKAQPNEDEVVNLRQCLRVLNKHDICLVCPKELDKTAYDNIFSEEGKSYAPEFFDKEYFCSVKGYNQLMLTREFYLRFVEWDYMLIYQLDAYVFEDRLEEWCEKGYDYVGAPWCTLKRRIDWNNSGNGGFSLRKISSFIRLFDHKGNVLNLAGLWKFHRYRGPLHKWPLIIRGLFGQLNQLEDYTNGKRINEDLFYACLGHLTKNPFKIPDSHEAAFFAFEEKPAELFAHTKKLPFGCHAYRKYDVGFYKPYMKHLQETSVNHTEKNNYGGTDTERKDS